MNVDGQPFALDVAATKYLADAVRCPPVGTVAGIWTGLGKIVKDKHGSVISQYQGEHWFVGFDNEDQLCKKGFVPVMINGVSFMIHATAIDTLRGSTLTYDRKDKILKKVANNRRQATPLRGSPAP